MAGWIAVKPPFWFRIIAVLALCWEGAGCLAYVMQVSMSDADLAKLPAVQQEIWRMMPAWATGAYAVAVWGGLLGAIALLLRKAWARPLFIISLIAALAQFGWTFLGSPILAKMSMAEAVPFPATIILIALFLAWFAGHARRRAWLT